MSTELTERLERIEKILKSANDVYSPVVVQQAGLQLARVEVPWLVEQIKVLAGMAETSDLSNVVSLEEYRASRQEPAQAVAV